MTAPAPQTGGTGYPWHAARPLVSGPPGRPAAQGRRAGLVTRALANVLDVCVVLLVLAGGYAAVAAGSFLINPPAFRFPAPGFGLMLLLGGGVQAVYFAVSWALTGRTYGDEVLGL